MRAKVSTTASGDVLLESVLLVTTHDGRRGFTVRPADAERLLAEPEVTVTGPDSSTLVGVATVVRSGAAYEEVRGRTRMAGSRLTRWANSLRLRRETTVVLLGTGTA